MPKKPQILVVEDDQFLRKIYLTKLSSENFDVITAVDGEEAISVSKKEVPDLILLDLILPKIDGFEVLRELKNDPKTRDIPVIILSNLGQESDIERGMKLGAQDYLVKARFSINEVVSKIRAALKGKKIKARKEKVVIRPFEKEKELAKLKEQLIQIQKRIKELEEK